MATIYWAGGETRARHYYHDEDDPVNFDIHDWRLLWQGKVFIKRFKRGEFGTIISAKKDVRFIPHLNIADIMRINAKGKDHKQKVFNATLFGSDHAITYCGECMGLGRFDWIARTSRERRPKWREAQCQFERDESIYHVYPGCDTMLLAHTKLNEGDVHCEACNGIGLEVDGRHTIYRGMKGIKKKLYPIEAEDYNDKLKLKGLLK